MKYLILSVASSFLFNSCDYDDSKLQIENKTSNDFYLIPYTESSLQNYPNILDLENYFTEAHSKSTYHAMNTTWEKRILQGKTKQLEMYLIEADKARTMKKEELIKDPKNFKHFSFNINQLNKCNWLIEIDTMNAGEEIVITPCDRTVPKKS